RVFGAGVFHPDLFRHSYFLQDVWKPTPTLALTLGLRYENFGQPANALRYPSFENRVASSRIPPASAAGGAWRTVCADRVSGASPVVKTRFGPCSTAEPDSMVCLAEYSVPARSPPR